MYLSIFITHIVNLCTGAKAAQRQMAGTK